MTTITISTKTGRRVTDTQAGNVTHARVNGAWRALCGTEPGKLSDWSSYPIILDEHTARMKAEKYISCERCRRALYKWGERPHFGGVEILRPKW